MTEEQIRAFVEANLRDDIVDYGNGTISVTANDITTFVNKELFNEALLKIAEKTNNYGNKSKSKQRIRVHSKG